MSSPSQPSNSTISHDLRHGANKNSSLGVDAELDINDQYSEFGLLPAHETAYVVDSESTFSSEYDQFNFVDISHLRKQVVDKIDLDPTMTKSESQVKAAESKLAGRSGSTDIVAANLPTSLGQSGAEPTNKKIQELTPAMIAFVEMSLAAHHPQVESTQAKPPSLRLEDNGNKTYGETQPAVKSCLKYEDLVRSDESHNDAEKLKKGAMATSHKVGFVIDSWLEELAKDDERSLVGGSEVKTSSTPAPKPKFFGQQVCQPVAPTSMADKMRLYSTTAPRADIRAACRAAAAAIDAHSLIGYLTRNDSQLSRVERIGKSLVKSAWEFIQRKAKEKGGRNRKKKAAEKKLKDFTQSLSRAERKELRHIQIAEAKVIQMERTAKRRNRYGIRKEQDMTQVKSQKVIRAVRKKSNIEQGYLPADQSIVGRLSPPSERFHDQALQAASPEQSEWKKEHLEMCREHGASRIAYEAYCIKSAGQQITSDWTPGEALELPDQNRLIALLGPDSEAVRSGLSSYSASLDIARWLADPAKKRKEKLGKKSRLKNDVFHYVWSFSEELLEAARSGRLDQFFESCVRRLLARLDLSDHRCVCILHVDSDGKNPHLHIIGSRVRGQDSSLLTIPGYMRKPALWIHARAESAVHTNGVYSQDDIDVLGGTSRPAVKGECKMHRGLLVAVRSMVDGPSVPVKLQNYEAICRMERAAPPLGLIGGLLLYGLGGSRHHFSTAEMRSESDRPCDAVLSFLEYLLRCGH